MRRFSRVNRALLQSHGPSRCLPDEPAGSSAVRQGEGAIEGVERGGKKEEKKSIPRPGALKPFRLANRKTTAEQNRRQAPL